MRVGSDVKFGLVVSRAPTRLCLDRRAAYRRVSSRRTETAYQLAHDHARNRTRATIGDGDRRTRRPAARARRCVRVRCARVATSTQWQGDVLDAGSGRASIDGISHAGRRSNPGCDCRCCRYCCCRRCRHASDRTRVRRRSSARQVHLLLLPYSRHAPFAAYVRHSAAAIEHRRLAAERPLERRPAAVAEDHHVGVAGDGAVGSIAVQEMYARERRGADETQRECREGACIDNDAVSRSYCIRMLHCIVAEFSTVCAFFVCMHACANDDCSRVSDFGSEEEVGDCTALAHRRESPHSFVCMPCARSSIPRSHVHSLHRCGVYALYVSALHTDIHTIASSQLLAYEDSQLRARRSAGMILTQEDLIGERDRKLRRQVLAKQRREEERRKEEKERADAA